VGDDVPEVKLASLSGGLFSLSSVLTAQPLVRCAATTLDCIIYKG
jgi:hypothetical protein